MPADPTERAAEEDRTAREEMTETAGTEETEIITAAVRKEGDADQRRKLIKREEPAAPQVEEAAPQAEEAPVEAAPATEE